MPIRCEDDRRIRRIVRHPLGGFKGDEVKRSNPFAIDRINVLNDLNTSIDWIEGRRRKSDKSVLQRMRGICL